ncbi:hypothetical protein E3N88_12657 [Mikania micrantha]|uniref:Protein kinase domain-containing protein n=1 Tax=Mikania micrantha TaxID=192012 RepID=A0A5N6P7G9_9ASTR|nr:hypothetical protein E3N88_12657 [Mikania micrantha]
MGMERSTEVHDEESCLTSMKKSLDTCISSEQCLVSDEFITKQVQEEIIQEENGEVMGSDPQITWMKQYENGRPKELILPNSRIKQRWAYRATGYGGPRLKIKYYASVLEGGEYVTHDVFPEIIIDKDTQTESYKQTIEAVEPIETPAVGFYKASGVGTTTQQIGIVIKQNNFIIQAITSLLEEIKTVKEDVKELRQEIQKGKAPVVENEQLLEKLNKKLEKLSIGACLLDSPVSLTALYPANLKDKDPSNLDPVLILDGTFIEIVWILKKDGLNLQLQAPDEGPVAYEYGQLSQSGHLAIEAAPTVKQPVFNHIDLPDLQVSRVSRLEHDNVIKLLGFCVDDGRKRVKDTQPGQVLSWTQRVKIAVGAAKGLEYLHKTQTIHRDIKSSNVLLFDGHVAKIGDFDLSNEEPHMSERTYSTRAFNFGSHAPEYAMTGQLNSKSDVYSFGVVLLELLTGRKPVDHNLPDGQQSLVTWATPKLREDKVKECVDARLSGEYPPNADAKMAAIASLCLKYEPESRPHMTIVVKRLQKLLNPPPATKVSHFSSFMCCCRRST